MPRLGLVAALAFAISCATARPGTYVYSGGFTGQSLTLSSNGTFEFQFISDDTSSWRASGIWRCRDPRCRTFETIIQTSDDPKFELIPPFEANQVWVTSGRSVSPVLAREFRFQRR
jgi:hypothetical protein